MSRLLAAVIGTFFGTGLAPLAPATVGSFAYALLWWALWTGVGPIPVLVQVIALAAVTAVGVWAAGRLEQRYGEDPRRCVIDEVAGMQVTYLGLAAGPAGWLVGFLWFRIFDILKPLGVRRLERLDGGLGIMADDLGAGVLALLATQATVRLLGWQT
jgi:phosphatidylglycerophosphatase A